MAQRIFASQAIGKNGTRFILNGLRNQLNKSCCNKHDNNIIIIKNFSTLNEINFVKSSSSSSSASNYLRFIAKRNFVDSGGDKKKSSPASSSSTCKKTPKSDKKQQQQAAGSSGDCSTKNVTTTTPQRQEPQQCPPPIPTTPLPPTVNVIPFPKNWSVLEPLLRCPDLSVAYVTGKMNRDLGEGRGERGSTMIRSRIEAFHKRNLQGIQAKDGWERFHTMDSLTAEELAVTAKAAKAEKDAKRAKSSNIFVRGYVKVKSVFTRRKKNAADGTGDKKQVVKGVAKLPKNIPNYTPNNPPVIIPRPKIRQDDEIFNLKPIQMSTFETTMPFICDEKTFLTCYDCLPYNDVLLKPVRELRGRNKHEPVNVHGLLPNQNLIVDDFHYLLTPKEAMTSNMLDVYLTRLKDRNRYHYFPSVGVCQTVFSQAMINDNVEAPDEDFCSWYRDEDMTANEILLIPILNISDALSNLNKIGHFSLLIVDFPKRKFVYLDSLPSTPVLPTNIFLSKIRRYINFVAESNNRRPYDWRHWCAYCPDLIPKQTSGEDCGVYVCKYADCYTRGVHLNFTANDINFIRFGIAYHVMNWRFPSMGN